MSVPNFAQIPLAPEALEPGEAAPAQGPAWTTAEGIEVKALYSAQDLDAVAHLGTLPGLPPFLRGPYALSSIQN